MNPLIQLILAAAFVWLMCFIAYKVGAFLIERLVSRILSDQRVAHAVMIAMALMFLASGVFLLQDLQDHWFLALCSFGLAGLLGYYGWTGTGRLNMTEEEVPVGELLKSLKSLKGAKVEDFGVVLPDGMLISGTVGPNKHFSLFAPDAASWIIYRKSKRTEYTNVLIKSVEEKSDALSEYKSLLLEGLAGQSVTEIDYMPNTFYSLTIGNTTVEFHYFGAYDKDGQDDAEDEEWAEEERELSESEFYQDFAAEKLGFVLSLGEEPFFEQGDQHPRIEYLVTGQGVTRQTYTSAKAN